MLPTVLTVAVIVERHDSFLIVEKRVAGNIVVCQPSANIETDESPEQALVRGVLLETGYRIAVDELLGIYLWIHPQTRQQFLSIVYTAGIVTEDHDHAFDEHIQGVHWYSLGDIRQRGSDLMSPIVQRCTEDYVVGKRESNELLSRLMPIQNNVVQIMANACLV